MAEDSIKAIYETLTRCAHISKNAGGIGISMSNIRAAGSYINGTNGVSNGIVPLLRVYDATARYVDYRVHSEHSKLCQKYLNKIKDACI